MSSDGIKSCVVKMNPKKHCCRVCLGTKYSKGINLAESSHILELLEYCVGFTVSIEYTSHVLCVKCKKKIGEFEKFKRQCEKSEGFWKKFPIVNNAKFTEVVSPSNLSTLIKQETTDTEQECEGFNTENLEDFNEISYDTKDFSAVIDNKEKTCPNKNKDKCSSSEHKEKTYECVKCNRKYSTRKSLSSHMTKKCFKSNMESMQSAATKNMYLSIYETNECGLCDTPFSCDVSEHIRNSHWLKNNLQCDLCNYCGKDFAHMVTHRYTHCPSKKLYCIACNKRSFSMLALQFHFRSAHLKKPGGYCTFCDKTFDKFKTWKRHHRIHTESNKLYVCHHCNRKSLDGGEYHPVAHISCRRVRHSFVAFCHGCFIDKEFLYRHEIKTHLIGHTDSRQYVCEACGKGFRRASALKDHVYNIHETRQPVKCEHCNKIYKCENKLKIHLRNVAAEKPFICEVCSKKFHTETVLKKHMFWHTNERPFSCEVCAAKYKAKGELKVHMRKHSGERPYVCAVCFKPFRSSRQLKIHGSVHTGIRRHKCMHCEKSFHCKKTFLIHAAQHKNVVSVKLEPN